MRSPSATCSFVVLLVILAVFPIQAQTRSQASTQARILKLEDDRNLGGVELLQLLKHRDASVRCRAALSLGRIGDRRAIDALVDSLQKDGEVQVRLMAAFALGEIEDPSAADALLSALDGQGESISVRARIVEALGKVGSISSEGQALQDRISERLVLELKLMGSTAIDESRSLQLLTITALMRLRSQTAIEALRQQIRSGDAVVRAYAVNALSRSRRPIAAAYADLAAAASDSDAMVRANVARALGETGQREAFGVISGLLLGADERVRVNAVRGLATLNDRRAVTALLLIGDQYLSRLRTGHDPELNLLLELATAFGALKDPGAVLFLVKLRKATGIGRHPEIEIALARLNPDSFFEPLGELDIRDWRQAVGISQGLGEIESERSRRFLERLLDDADRGRFAAVSVPAILQAMKKVKVANLAATLEGLLSTNDIEIRATAAALFEWTDDDGRLSLMLRTLEAAKKDRENDVRLALLRSMGSLKSERATAAIRASLKDPDYLVRRLAIDLLQRRGIRESDARAEPVGINQPLSYYEGVMRRSEEPLIAVIETAKGRVTIELFAKDAPLTVENFVTLARRRYFDGLVFHRVVPNFVIQTGDPRGDGTGGPASRIRCEINLRAYTRGTVGMALSGKDTGGSQFFVTHSPAPHLDGGYTVFGQVVGGMDVVDRITRGDVIRRVTLRQGLREAGRRSPPAAH